VKVSLESALRKARGYQKKGDVAEAVKIYHDILKRFPGNKTVQLELNNLEIRQQQDSFPQDRLNELLALYNRGLLAETIRMASGLIGEFPHIVKPYDILAKTYAQIGNLDAAQVVYKQVLKLKPDYFEACNNLGAILINVGAFDEAISYLKRAIELKPDYANAYSNLGIAQSEMGDIAQAITSLRQAVKLQPQHVGAHNNLGFAFKEAGELEAAVVSFDNALALQPDYVSALANRIYLQAEMCDWRQYNEVKADSKIFEMENSNLAPFTLLTFEDAPEKQRIYAENFTRSKYKCSPFPEVKNTERRHEKLRIGYFSSDFYNHATMYLMASFFEYHDKKKFEIFAYSYGPDKDDEMRRRVMRDVDNFRDVRNYSDKKIAELAREDSVDIAVDLKGHTRGARTGIFCYRPAPIQISYLGYPGTMGADFIDYLIADDVVIPSEFKKHYSESIIYLPDSYQVNDGSRAISDRVMTRSEFNLPEEGFVFCTFNKNYKISPREFDIWMRLLKKVDGSILWVFSSNRQARENLLKEARVRGVREDRIVFADRLPQDEHLARLRLADLFLDTFNVNAHTTASDALWAGLPVVTKIGKSFPARVAASLLNAVGMQELVTETEAAYEMLALELATNKRKLDSIRQNLALNLETCPLFNTQLFVRHIETAFLKVYKLYDEGKAPETIRIMN
jgi:predicted O-linked N-acetylglucosamine transferase (SPINDLY family)